jgi:hypothetical protein
MLQKDIQTLQMNFLMWPFTGLVSIATKTSDCNTELSFGLYAHGSPTFQISLTRGQGNKLHRQLNFGERKSKGIAACPPISKISGTKNKNICDSQKVFFLTKEKGGMNCYGSS